MDSWKNNKTTPSQSDPEAETCTHSDAEPEPETFTHDSEPAFETNDKTACNIQKMLDAERPPCEVISSLDEFHGTQASFMIGQIAGWASYKLQNSFGLCKREIDYAQELLSAAVSHKFFCGIPKSYSSSIDMSPAMVIFHEILFQFPDTELPQILEFIRKTFFSFRPLLQKDTNRCVKDMYVHLAYRLSTPKFGFKIDYERVFDRRLAPAKIISFIELIYHDDQEMSKQIGDVAWNVNQRLIDIHGRHDENVSSDLISYLLTLMRTLLNHRAFSGIATHENTSHEAVQSWILYTVYENDKLQTLQELKAFLMHHMTYTNYVS